MRLIAIVSAALALLAAQPASAQDWAEFVSRTDGFRVNFPGQPAVSTTTFRRNTAPISRLASSASSAAANGTR